MSAAQLNYNFVKTKFENGESSSVDLEEAEQLLEEQNSNYENAIYSYLYAIKIKPNYAQAFNNLAVLLKKLGEINLAIISYIKAINLKPDFTDAYANFAFVIKNIRFTLSNVKFYPLLIYLINNGNYIRPSDLAPSILSLLKHDPLIKDLLLEENFTSRSSLIKLASS